MWKILISEIFYNRYIITFILFISAIHLILLHFWPEITGEIPSNRNIGYNQLNYMLINFLAIVLIYLSKFENRGRLHVLLPVRPKSLGINRLIIFTLYWIGLLLLFFLSTEISIYYLLDTKTLLAICTQTGMVFFLF